MAKRLYDLQALESFQKEYFDEFVEVQQFWGNLLDNFIFELPERFQYRWVIFEETHLNEWSSAYIVRRTNSVKVVEQFENKYREFVA